MPVAGIAGQPRAEQEERRPNPLSTALGEITTDRFDDLHIGTEMTVELTLDAREVIPDQRQDFGQQRLARLRCATRDRVDVGRRRSGYRMHATCAACCAHLDQPSFGETPLAP